MAISAAQPGKIKGTSITTPTPSGDNHTLVLGQLKETTEIAQRLRGDPKDSFVRVSEIMSALGARLVNSTLQPPLPGNAAAITVAASITGAGTLGAPLQLVNDTAAPGNNMVYGTSASGVLGWYAASAGSLTSPLSTKGDLWGWSTTNVRVPVGVNGLVLTADSTVAAGVSWKASSGGSGTQGTTIFLPGDDGQDGEPGRPGQTGAAGATGAQGPQGIPVFLEADAGADGEPGPPGQPGATGATGAQGSQGPPIFLEADAGADGDPGPPGATGPTGPAGSTGAQGPQGAPIFLEADAGADGEPGPPGQPGVAGATGATGLQGATGPAVYLEADSGTDGEPGPPGPAGPAGLAGTTGAQGPQGVPIFLEADAGADGEPGPPGQAGPMGPQGPAGTGGSTQSGFEILYQMEQPEEQWYPGANTTEGSKIFTGPVQFIGPDPPLTVGGVAYQGQLDFDIQNTGTAAGQDARISLVAGGISFAIFTINSNNVTPPVTGGPTGAQGLLRTLGGYPIVFGTNNTYRGQIDQNGLWQIVNGAAGTHVIQSFSGASDTLALNAPSGQFTSLVFQNASVLQAQIFWDNTNNLLCLGAPTSAITIGAAGQVKVAATTLSGGTSLLIAPGAATTGPLALSNGTLMTSPNTGTIEFLQPCIYFSPALASRGVLLNEWVEIMSGTKTLTSQTAAQAYLNGTTNGAVTLPVGTYEFDAFVSLTAMSSTSGAFGFSLGGTATFTQGWMAMASKSALATASAPLGSYNTAANVAVSVANTTTTGWVRVTGTVRVTVTGTVIPEISLGVAASAVVGANSYARFRPVGVAAFQSVGNWS